MIPRTKIECLNKKGAKGPTRYPLRVKDVTPKSRGICAKYESVGSKSHGKIPSSNYVVVARTSDGAHLWRQVKAPSAPKKTKADPLKKRKPAKAKAKVTSTTVKTTVKSKVPVKSKVKTATGSIILSGDRNRLMRLTPAKPSTHKSGTSKASASRSTSGSRSKASTSKARTSKASTSSARTVRSPSIARTSRVKQFQLLKANGAKLKLE